MKHAFPLRFLKFRGPVRHVVAKIPASAGKNLAPDAEQVIHKENVSKKSDPSAATSIWLQRFWLSHTRMLRDLKMFDKMFRMSSNLMKACQRDTNRIIQICCQQGRQRKHGPKLASFISGRNCVERTFATLGFLLLLKYESTDGIYALVERMEVRAGRCESANPGTETGLQSSGAKGGPCSSQIVA